MRRETLKFTSETGGGGGRLHVSARNREHRDNQSRRDHHPKIPPTHLCNFKKFHDTIKSTDIIYYENSTLQSNLSTKTRNCKKIKRHNFEKFYTMIKSINTILHNSTLQ
jgi:hypothetical protein